MRPEKPMRYTLWQFDKSPQKFCLNPQQTLINNRQQNQEIYGGFLLVISRKWLAILLKVEICRLSIESVRLFRTFNGDSEHW